MTEFRQYYHRHLPHLQPEGSTLFITFRLAGSLPTQIINELEEKQKQENRKLAMITDQQKHHKQDDQNKRLTFGRWDTALDRIKSDPHWLDNPGISRIVLEALHFRDGRVYDLWAYCLMPNHVHLVFTPLPNGDGSYPQLYRILQSLKSHTAKQANKILKRQGNFWQAESYDRVIRDEDELNRIVQYVMNNPVKAGLVQEWDDWSWSYAKEIM